MKPGGITLNNTEHIASWYSKAEETPIELLRCDMKHEPFKIVDYK